MPNATTTLLVVVQNAILLEGIVLLIEADPDIRLLATATTLENGLASFHQNRPDCVVLDLDMPSATSLLGVETMLATEPRVKIIGLATYELDGCVSRALAIGVRAVIAKDQISQALTDIIRRT